MKKEISNNQIVLIAFIAISLSIFSIFLSFGNLGITGAASTGVGYTNVTITETTDITVVRAQINFTDSNPGESKNSVESDDVDASCTTDGECGINITNDGSATINITMTNTENLFSSASLVYAQHYVYNITMGDSTTDYVRDNRCSTGYVNTTATGNSGLALTGSWRAMPAQGAGEVAICCLNYTDDHDWAQVDINITVPGDEPAGIKSGTITFTAIAWE
ncbi:MAG: hypothetical protein L6408_02485 [Nanoarchaeota archaeon]|nr:hypothetical protein [Nanoarchaeota archaeon]